jgi:hypothetical protein
LPPLEFYQKYSRFLKTLLGANGDPNFIHKVKTILKKTLRELFREEKIPQFELMEYVIEYISSAQIGIISYWLENDMELPVDQLGELIKKITLNGPVGFLLMEMGEKEPMIRFFQAPANRLFYPDRRRSRSDLRCADDPMTGYQDGNGIRLLAMPTARQALGCPP